MSQCSGKTGWVLIGGGVADEDLADLWPYDAATAAGDAPPVRHREMVYQAFDGSLFRAGVKFTDGSQRRFWAQQSMRYAKEIFGHLIHRYLDQLDPSRVNILLS